MIKTKQKKELDFVAIGDIVIDNFIELKEAEIKTTKGKNKLCMDFANKIPYKKMTEISAVGNSPNAAVSASRLGLRSALIANIGNDSNGKKCLISLKKDRVSTKYVKINNKKYPTNYHFVLSFQTDRTILVKHTEFNYKMPNIGSPKWIYLSSLAENSLPFHKVIVNYIKKHPKIKLAFQPGTFQMNFGYKKLKEIYKITNLFFCNKEEAKRILKSAKKPAPNDIKKLLKEIKKLGPKNVVITDGTKGAYFYDGKEIYQMPMYPDKKTPFDRTGAGDAFSSTFTTAIALGKSTKEALMWGPINSMSVVQYLGAQKGLLKRKELLRYLSKAPKSYKVMKIK